MNQVIRTQFTPGQIWPDNNGTHINAHGGGILFHDGVYYWFGEHTGERMTTRLPFTFEFQKKEAR